MVRVEGTWGSAQDTPGVRVIHQVGPWFALAAVTLSALIIWTGFQMSLRATGTQQTPGTGMTTSSVEPTVSTAVTGTIAVTRLDATVLRAAADVRSDVLFTVKKGTKLQVLNRTDTWLRVKDPAGHIGWVPNSSKSIELRKK